MAGVSPYHGRRLETAMTRVCIDRQPAAVKQFFRSLPPGGALITLNGKPVAWVVPMREPDTEWSDAKNDRRCDLIDRKIARTITPDERLELELLQEEMHDHVERVAPLPIDYARQLHRELPAKAAATTERRRS